MAKRKTRGTYLNETSGSREAFTNFGSYMNRSEPPLQYGGQPAVRAPEPERSGPQPTRRGERQLRRQEGRSVGVQRLFERFVRFIDRNVAQPILDWISAGEPEDPEAIASIQQSLAAEGQYDGPIDGTKNEQFMSALERMKGA